MYMRGGRRVAERVSTIFLPIAFGAIQVSPDMKKTTHMTLSNKTSDRSNEWVSI